MLRIVFLVRKPIKITKEYITRNIKVNHKMEYKKGICHTPVFVETISQIIPSNKSDDKNANIVPASKCPNTIFVLLMGFDKSKSICPF